MQQQTNSNNSNIDLPPLFTTPEELWGEEVARFLFENELQNNRLGFSADPTKPVDEAVWDAARQSIGNIEFGPLHKRGGQNGVGWEDQTQENFLKAAKLFLDNPGINPTIHGPVDINWMGLSNEGLKDDIKEKEVEWVKKNIVGLDDEGNLREDWSLKPIFNVIEYKKQKGLLDKDFRTPIVFHASPAIGKDFKIVGDYYVDKEKKDVIALVDEKTGKLLYAGSRSDLEERGFSDKNELKKHLEDSLYFSTKSNLAEKVQQIDKIESQKNLLNKIYNIVKSKDELNEEELKLIANKNMELHNLGINLEDFLEVKEDNVGSKKSITAKIKNKDQLLQKIELTKDFILPSIEKNVSFTLEDTVRDFYKHLDENKTKEFEERIKEIKSKGNNESLLKTVKEEASKLLKEVQENPFKVKDLEEVALEKASDSIAETALAFYKNPKLKEHAFVAVETFFPEDFFSTGEDMKKLIEKSREKFVNKLKEQGISEEEAKKMAEELIGITLDMGHWNLWKSRDPSVDDEWLAQQVEKIAPYVKHVHLTDNLGVIDTHQEIGTGNVPNKKALEVLLKKGKWKEKPGTITVEWGSPFGPNGKQPSNRENWIASINPYFAKVRAYRLETGTKYNPKKFDSPQGIYNKLIQDYFTSFLK